MPTVPELIDRIDELEMERARAWARFRVADRALVRANEELRDAMVRACRDPEQVVAIARLPTVDELAFSSSFEPPAIVQ